MKKIIKLFLFATCILSTVMAQEAQNNFVAEGIKMHDKGDYEAAIELYKKALISNPGSVQAKYEMASSYLQLKDYKNAIKYSNMVINARQDYVDQAYIIKGTALDYTGKQTEAFTIYKQAIRQYPKNQLLHYNLALTAFNLKNFKESDNALEQSLKLNPLHASSHFLAGLNKLIQGKNIEGMLALYNFLLLEPKTKRSTTALQALEDAWKETPPKKEDKILVKENEAYQTAMIMLPLLESAKNNEANKNKTAVELLIQKTHNLFTILGEEKKGKRDFWWRFYVDYFYAMSKNMHTEAFCYYITQSKDNGYDEWVKTNLSKIEALSDWYTKYLHKL